MSISVKNLTKVYGSQRAIDDLTFEVGDAQVLGFLGPNGAGKSTTMKILSCYLQPTEGQAMVNGFDVQEEPLKVREGLGYLPEHNPLYLEMYVREYLGFVASLHKLKNAKLRIAEVIGITGLEKEAHKQIGMLSKGYRQRVGLAQAMIHDPSVLILDEPTAGLDPNQLVEIRQLIKDLGKEKTVIFSTHIMQEVQAICDRVIIINNGKIVMDGSIDTIRNYTQSERAVKVHFSRQVFPNTLKEIKGVTRIEDLGDHRYVIYSKESDDLRPVLFDFAVSKNVQIIEMYQQQSSVEDVFQKLTRVQNA